MTTLAALEAVPWRKAPVDKTIAVDAETALAKDPDLELWRKILSVAIKSAPKGPWKTLFTWLKKHLQDSLDGPIDPAAADLLDKLPDTSVPRTTSVKMKHAPAKKRPLDEILAIIQKYHKR